MRRLLISSLFLAAMSPAFSAPHEDAGRSGFHFLNNASSARMAAMGRAFTAVSDDADAMFSNPGGLGHQRYLDVAFSHRQEIEEIRYNNAAVVLPISNFGSSSLRQLGAFGISAGFVDYGNFTGRDSAGNPLPDFEATDTRFGLAYGRRLIGGLSVGARGDYFKSSIGGIDAGGIGVSLGALYRTADETTSLGVMVSGLGGDGSYITQTVRQDQVVSGGVSFQPVKDRILLTAEAYDANDDQNHIRAGAEFWANPFLALRAGYDSGADFGSGLSLGAGIQVERLEFAFFPFRRFRLDYAFLSADEVGDDSTDSGNGFHHVSVSFQFGEDLYAAE